MRYLSVLILFSGLVSFLGAMEKSFGRPEMRLAKTTEQGGRKILRYEHENVPEWGYEVPQTDYFLVLPPAGEPKATPLQVVLHSAGHSGDAVLKQSFQKPDWFHNVGLKEHYVLYLDCRKNKRQDWWWGAKNDIKGKYKDIYTPAEKRILTTIEWVIQKYGIDRNRVYLSGVSMGGSGSLGIGMCRGDIFAAINVTVPAGVDHVKARLFDKKVPDPPVMVNFSSFKDGWSKNQGEFIKECQDKRYHLVFAFGPHGHQGSVAGYHAPAKAFPWREIRKDQAYAIFTNASTDETWPGTKPANHQGGNGQIGALYRWKTIKDTSKQFEIELRMVTREEVGGREDLPTRATVEVSLRRLQNFKLGSKKGSWKLKRDGKTLGAGKVGLDQNGLLTIGELPLSTKPAVLSISQ